MYATKEPPFVLIYGAIIVPLLALQIALLGFVGTSGVSGNIAFLVPLLIAFSPYIVAQMVKVSAKTAARTKRSILLSSPLSADAAFKRLASASFAHSTLVDSDSGRHTLVLFSPMKRWSMGFYYPVFVTPRASGSTIEVGIARRAPQHERTISDNHKACAAEIEKALAA